MTDALFPISKAPDYIQLAINKLAYLKQQATLTEGFFCPYTTRFDINLNLKQAGKDYSALDPTGQASAEEMKAVVQEAYAAAAVNKA
ncbi:MAG: hypothetical protein FJX22_05075, partial [Alphaproteobacteria bacterium]|nr:hypothetical protein [Alphaproteobacteria bacterium]